MKKIIKYQLLACILVFSASTTTAQTGVLTHDPSTPLHLDASNDNAATITPIQALNDVVVTAAGNLGVGVLAPIAKVDLRSTDQKGIIGLGTNTQSPAAAGKGAIRYTIGNIPNTLATELGYLEYSDGSKWIPLPLTPPDKALVNATKSTAQSIANNSEVTITGWNEIVDVGNNFVPVSGIFAAPRDGFYLVSFNITMSSGSIANSSYIETIIESDNASTINIPAFRTINTYPAFQASTINNFVSGNCNAIFQLEEGNTIRFRVRHTLGGSRSVLNDGSLNNISISEL